MTRFAAILCLLLLFSVPAAAHASPQSQVVLVVDQQRVLAECRACEAAALALDERKAGVIARLDRTLAELEVRITKLQNAIQGVSTLPDAEKEAAMNRFEPDSVAIQIMTGEFEKEQKAQAKIQAALEADVSKQLVAGLVPILEKIRTERGATVVIDKSSVLALAPTIDITVEALARLDDALPAITMPPPAE